MIRTYCAALLCVCGMTSVASAQVFTSYDSPAYTTYYRAPASSFANYGYSGYGYRDGWGPLGLVNWRWMAGGYPVASSSYASTSYTAGYAPLSYAPSTTSFYAPSTSYYGPVAGTTLASYSAPIALASNSCCVPCCTPCSTGNCPGGNCAMNYAPADMSPRPDPASSGSRTLESESGGSRSTDPGTGGSGSDNWSRPADGYDSTERGAGYPPQTKIEKKAPTDVDDRSGPEPAGAAQPEPEAEDTFEAPGNGSDPAAQLLDLDTKVTAAPGVTRERLALRARFQSPRLARAVVTPSTFPTADDMRLVRK